MPSRPSTYLNWVPSGNPSYITQPTSGQQTTGWTANERPPFQYMNWLFYITDQWIQWFDSNTFQSVGAFDSVAASGNGLVIAGGVIYAQSATALVPGMVNTTSQIFAGDKQFNATVGFGGAVAATAIVTIGTTNPLSGTSQRGSQVISRWSAAATVSGIGYLSAATTAATSFTMPLRAQFYSQDTAKGAGSTITRDVAYYAEQPTEGTTGNAILADNASFSGNYFINQNSGLPSVFGGTLTFPSVTSGSADAVGTAMTVTGADAIVQTSTIGDNGIPSSGGGSSLTTSFVDFLTQAIPGAGKYLVWAYGYITFGNSTNSGDMNAGWIMNFTDSSNTGLTGVPPNILGNMRIVYSGSVVSQLNFNSPFSALTVVTFSGADTIKLRLKRNGFTGEFASTAFGSLAIGYMKISN